MSKKSRYKNRTKYLTTDLIVPQIKSSPHNKKLRFKIIVNVLMSMYVLVLGFFIFYHWYYANKIVSKVYIDGIDFSKKSVDVAINDLKAKNKTFDSIKIKIGDKHEYKFSPLDIDFEYLNQETIKDAYSVGRDKLLFFGIPSKINAFTKGIYISSYYKYNDQKLNNFISSIESDTKVMQEEPKFLLKDGVITIQKGKNGSEIDGESFRKDLLKRIIFNDKSDLNLKLIEHKTDLTEDDLKKLYDELKIIASKDHIIRFKDKTWTLKREELLALLKVIKRDNRVDFLPDLEYTKKYIESIAEEVNMLPKGLDIEIKDGKVLKFNSSTDGIKVNVESSVKNTIKNILENQKATDLVYDVSAAPKASNEFGIEELVAEGKSRFRGSIPNRIHNVGLASSKIDGALVAPGEIYSFVNSVGKIDSKAGYKTAYVISKGRTILGDGGGVCQVSTTLFRAALYAGFPIISRTAHAYRVGYYEQDAGPGLDATIYSPSVDFKFKNDLKSYIYIAREFDPKAMTLAFKIYGKKDDRKVEVTKSEMVTKVAPPPTILEEAPDLVKGQKVQVEHSAWGGVARFTRKIKISGEETIETYKSNYQAWPAVYRVGTKE